MLAGLLIVFCLLNGSQVPPTQPSSPSEMVVAIDWRRFENADAAGTNTQTAAGLLNRSLRYNLAWAERTHPVSADGAGYLLEKLNEHGVRPPASLALATAIALQTRVYDEHLAGLPREEAKARLLRMIRGVAATHGANTSDEAWGDGWQTALWASMAGKAAWLMWDELDVSTRHMVARMVVFEADRFLRPGYQVPYWNGKGGDTKAEENAWNATIHQLAVAMMPRHPHAAGWKRIGSELMVSAFATREDWQSNSTIVDGRPVKEWLHGFNLRDDGAVVNHHLIHCDYMTCFSLNLRSYLTQSLAGQPVPQSARFNADRVYRALTMQRWPSPPFKPPGGTMYVPGKAEVYYPQGTDWSRCRFDLFWHVDTCADLLALDNDLPHRAAEWRAIRGQRLVQMQSRHADGRLFAEGEFTTYRGAEQMAVRIFADTLLLNWLHDHRAISREADWNEPQRASVP